MGFRREIEAYAPQNAQETSDRQMILELIDRYPDTILTRDNRLAHLTSSGLVMNARLDKVLMAHHHIYQTWAWTGGHADGDGDLLAVARREACEETGVKQARPLSRRMASLDVLPVYGHMKNGRYVGTHLHLSAAYILIADETERLTVCAAENSAVRWLEADRLDRYVNEPYLLAVYAKLIGRARRYGAAGERG